MTVGITVVDTPAEALPFGATVAGAPPLAPPDPMDGDEALTELRRVEDWWCEARDAHAANRAEMMLDHDYYDNLQWSELEKAELIARGQAPLVFNKLSMAVDWVTGTERRTRVDWSVHPRKEGSEDEASTKDKLLKYLADANRTGWERSRAFKDAVIGGVGWTEQTIRADSTQELLQYAYVPWSQVSFDPFSRSMDLDDCRYVHKRRWLDLDYAQVMFPDRAGVLASASRTHLWGDEEYYEDNRDLPQVFRRYDSTGAQVVDRRWATGLPTNASSWRLRVPTTETWFRQPRRIQRVWGSDFDGREYDSDLQADTALSESIQSGYVSLTDAVTEDIRLAIWVPGAMLYRSLSPFKHGTFPLTPIWAKRRDKDGMPYGIVRGVRDAQDDYNKRRSKALWLLSSNQLLHEEDAIDEDRLADVERDLARPNARIEFKKGALSGGKIKIERNIELAESQVMLLEQDAAHIHDGSGVNRENLGRDSNAQSGRAIIAKQQEGAVTTADLFDNLRLEVQLSGQKMLANLEQFMTLPAQFRIAGKGPRAKDDWLNVNKPEWDEATGQWRVVNDVTRDQADFVVDQQDFRETVRQSQSEQIFEMLMKMPPEMTIQLLDLAVELTELPQADELVQRIRKINGQGDPESAETPEAIAEKQARDEQQRQEQELALRERLAKVGLDEARTNEILAKARAIQLGSKGKAMDIAGLVNAMLPLAPAADRLYQNTNPEG